MCKISLLLVCTSIVKKPSWHRFLCGQACMADWSNLSAPWCEVRRKNYSGIRPFLQQTIWNPPSREGKKSAWTWKKKAQQQTLYCLELSAYVFIYIYIYIFVIYIILYIYLQLSACEEYILRLQVWLRHGISFLHFSLHTWTRMRENSRLRQAIRCTSEQNKQMIP